MYLYTVKYLINILMDNIENTVKQESVGGGGWYCHKNKYQGEPE
jgi:hypothetical protein